MQYVSLILRTLNPIMAGAIAAIGLSLPVLAETASVSPQATKQPMLLAQLAGQCRQVNRQVAVFTAANCNSGASRLLNQGAQVILNAPTATNGFIAIQGGGFVQTANLTTCGTNPPPQGNLCRRVIQQDGLIIRANADPNSAQLGFVPFNGRVTLTTSPPTTQVGFQNRSWVQIAAPAAGWVSNGFVGGGTSNLGMCP